MSSSQESIPSGEPADGMSELYFGFRQEFLRHAGSLFQDAYRRTALAVEEAKKSGITLKDIFVAPAPLGTPVAESVCLLVTVDGEPITPTNSSVPHFYLYIPDPGQLKLDLDQAPRMVWVERRESGNIQRKVLTQDVFRDYPDTSVPDVGEEPLGLDQSDGFSTFMTLLQEVQDCRLAPVARI
jgi:hypothetical protein